MTSIVSAVVVFGALVLVHEWGHFVCAKLTGMYVREFAIGFGPKVISRRWGETVYSLRCVPLGGFNDIAGMEPDDDEYGERSYNRKPLWQRLIVIVAGAAMNLLLPIFLFWGMFLYTGAAAPDPAPIMGEVIADRPAYVAGLRDGDRVTAIDGKNIDSWQSFAETVQGSGGKALRVEFSRNGVKHEAVITPQLDEKTGRPLVGVRGNIIVERLGVADSFLLALQKDILIVRQMVRGLAELFTGESLGDIAGPIGVAKMAGDVAQRGILPLINFAGLLSLNLGIVNLLPIPALDGGHVIVLLLEGLRGKPLRGKALEYTQIAGIAVILMITLMATKNDIMRIFF